MRAKIRESAVPYLLNYMQVFVFMVLMGVCQYEEDVRYGDFSVLVTVTSERHMSPLT